MNDGEHEGPPGGADARPEAEIAACERPFRQVAALPAIDHGRPPARRAPRNASPPALARLTAEDRIIDAVCACLHAPALGLVFDGTRTSIRVKVELAQSQSGTRVLRVEPRTGTFDPLYTHAGQRLQLRFTNESGLYAIETHALVGNPYALFCQWPRSVDHADRRATPRLELPPGHLPRVGLPLEGGGVYWTESVRDLSEDGLRLEVVPEVILTLGRPVRAELQLEAGVGLTVILLPRSISGDDRTGGMLYGCEFVYPTVEFDEALARFVRRTFRFSYQSP